MYQFIVKMGYRFNLQVPQEGTRNLSPCPAALALGKVHIPMPGANALDFSLGFKAFPIADT